MTREDCRLQIKIADLKECLDKIVSSENLEEKIEEIIYNFEALNLTI